MAWEGINRRRFPRANYPCTIRIRRKGSADEFHTKTENIGCGGICVMLPKDIGIFNPVEVKLDLQNGQQDVNCDGTIVWAVHRGQLDREAPNFFDTGIEFVNIKEEDKVRIDKIVKVCLQKDES